MDRLKSRMCAVEPVSLTMCAWHFSVVWAKMFVSNKHVLVSLQISVGLNVSSAPSSQTHSSSSSLIVLVFKADQTGW